MTKPVKLKIELQYDFLLFGIVSSEPVYRVAWLINEALRINLSEAEKRKLYNSKKEVLQFFDYFISEEPNDEIFELIHNKCETGYLLEEHSKIDFLLKITHSLSDVSNIVKKLKHLQGVTMVFNIDVDTLKSKNRLFFDEQS